MVKSPANPFFDFDVSKILGDFKIPGVDYDGLLATQRRNIEAITNANRVAFEGLQAIAKRQTEILQQTVEELSRNVKDLSGTGAPQDKAAKQAELTKEAFERALSNMREMAEMVARSSNETFEVINKRVTEGLEEIRDLIAKGVAKK